MTSEHKLKIIPLNEEEKAHEELERAINDVNKNKQKVFDLTVFLIGKIQDRFIKEKIELVSLEGPSLEDKKKLMYNLQDLAGKMEREIKSNEMKGFIPSNAGISYHGHSSKDDDTFPGIPERKREKITLQPADIPKDELTRIFQKHEAKLHYHSAKIHTKMGDKLIKMNYISDDPRLNERLLAELLSEIITFALSGLQVFSWFIDYWEKAKTKETLTNEDKEIIRMLLHAIFHRLY